MEIEKICKKYNIRNYTIKDGLVNVDGNVDLGFNKLTELPLRFGRVSGHFDCRSNNELTSLKGSPLYVGGNFNCGSNNLTNLKYSPMEVGGGYYCHGNQLKTLRGLEECFFMKKIYCGGSPVDELFSLFVDKEWSCADVNRLNDLIDEFSIEELNEWLIEEGYGPVKKLENYE